MRVQLNVCVWTVTVTTNSFEKYGCHLARGSAMHIGSPRAAPLGGSLTSGSRESHEHFHTHRGILHSYIQHASSASHAGVQRMAQRTCRPARASVTTPRQPWIPYAVEATSLDSHLRRPFSCLPAHLHGGSTRHASSLGAHAASLTLRPLLRNCAIAASLFSRCARAASPAARSAAIFAGSDTTSTFACVGSSP